MKRKLPYYLAGMMLFLCLWMFVPGKAAAANNYTITYADVYGTQIATEQVTEGSAISLPAETDLLAWIYDDCRMATTALIPTRDMTITAIHNADVSAKGTLDSGNIIWFIYDTKLYVTGNGTISLLDKYSTGTKKYGFSVSSFSAEQPAVAASFKTAQAIGDEKTTGWGTLTVPEDTRKVNLNVSRPISFAGATVGATSPSLEACTPWSDYAEDIVEAYFSDDIKLSGNLTLFFNPNSAALLPNNIQDSIFSNLNTIHMYADTSGVTRMGGMYAKMPALTQIFVRDGATFNMASVTDAAAMFYGDEALLCEFANSLVNSMDNLENVKDARYMFFGCKSLHQPNVKSWNVSGIEDASFMFAGCNDLGLTCNAAANTNKYDISSWNLGNAYSTAFMFAGGKIDYAKPSSNFWGGSGNGYNVLTGDVDANALNLVKDQVTVYMFANNKNITGFTLTTAMPVLQDASGMVAWCSKMSKVDMQGFSAPVLENAIAMFFGSCEGEGGTLSFKNASLPILSDARYMFYNTGYSDIDFEGCALLKLTNTQGMFASCDNLQSLGRDGAQTWNLSLNTDASYMFAGDRNLKAVNTANWGMDTVADISHMFEDCERLTSVQVAGWNVGALKYMEGAFYNSGITSFSAPSWNAVSLENAFMALAQCPNLAAVSMDGWKLNSLVNAAGMFKDDSSLSEISISGSAPNMEDCSGMFMGCVSLKKAVVPKLLSAKTSNASYMFDADMALTTVDAGNWTTSGVVYGQAMFRDCTSLSSLMSGSGATYTALQDAGCMYKNCKSLPSDALQAAVNRMKPAALKDAYETFCGAELLKSIDLSGVSLASVTDMTRMLAQEGNELTVIKVPSDFATGITDMTVGGENIFRVGTATVTDFTIAGTMIPANLKKYDWSSDKREFLKDGGAFVNDVAGTTYFFTKKSQETVKLKEDAQSTFKLQNTPLPVTFSWKKGESALDTVTNTHSTNDEGTYTVTAALADIKNGGTIIKKFTLVKADYISSISAEYTGDPIPIGDNYTKKDVIVKVYQNGSKDTYTVLGVDDFEVDSLKVTKVGDNTYTATYIDPDKTTFTDEFTVPGKRVIGEIKAVYNGPVIRAGNNYDSANVTLTAYYADDTKHEEGFEVKASGFSSLKVKDRGDNTFYAYYKDKTNGNKEFEAPFVVKGYLPVKSISAEYNGPAIVVGNNYDKAHVIVTLNFDEDIKDQTTKEFALDSLKVTQVGDNSYKASFTDEYGSVYSDTFVVKGIEKKPEDKNPPSNGDDGSKDTDNGTDTSGGDTRSADIYTGTGDGGSAAPAATTAGAVKTGDDQNLIGWIFSGVVIVLLLGATVVYVIRFKKRKNQ